jgi:hypothetical protein
VDLLGLTVCLPSFLPPFVLSSFLPSFLPACLPYFIFLFFYFFFIPAFLFPSVPPFASSFLPSFLTSLLPYFLVPSILLSVLTSSIPSLHPHLPSFLLSMATDYSPPLPLPVFISLPPSLLLLPPHSTLPSSFSPTLPLFIVEVGLVSQKVGGAEARKGKNARQPLPRRRHDRRNIHNRPRAVAVNTHKVYNYDEARPHDNCGSAKRRVSFPCPE